MTTKDDFFLMRHHKNFWKFAFGGLDPASYEEAVSIWNRIHGKKLKLNENYSIMHFDEIHRQFFNMLTMYNEFEDLQIVEFEKNVIEHKDNEIVVIAEHEKTLWQKIKEWLANIFK